jgi:hypothetical protein
MATTNILDADNDLFKLAAKLCGNATAFRFLRRALTFSADANKTLTSSEYDAPILDFGTGTALSATRNVVVPLTDGAVWIVRNGTNGAQSIQIIGATGTGVTIANGKTAIVFCDGVNVVRVTADNP